MQNHFCRQCRSGHDRHCTGQVSHAEREHDRRGPVRGERRGVPAEVRAARGLLLLLLLHGAHQEPAAAPVFPLRDVRPAGGGRQQGLLHRQGERHRGDRLRGEGGGVHHLLLQE